MKKLKIGISSCLLGESVRFNGEHKRNPTVIDLLGQRFEAVPVCPEVELGMGVPREPVRLVGSNMRMAGESSNPYQKVPLGISKSPPRVVVRMVVAESGKDWTEAMAGFNSKKLEALRQQNLSGFIFKSRSPSCGPGQVPLHHEQSGEKSSTEGLFARALMKHFPSLPVIDEETLQDEIARAGFIACVLQHGEEFSGESGKREHTGKNEGGSV